MSDYRVCRLDQTGKVIEPARIIDCADDRSAVMKAKEIAGRNGCEVWRDDHLIATVGTRNLP